MSFRITASKGVLFGRILVPACDRFRNSFLVFFFFLRRTASLSALELASVALGLDICYVDMISEQEHQQAFPPAPPMRTPPRYTRTRALSTQNFPSFTVTNTVVYMNVEK